MSLKEKIVEAVSLLQKHEPEEGYYVAFSGGKDSIVLLDLVRRSGVKHDVHFNATSVDPPELLEFIAEHYPDINTHQPKLTMFELIEREGCLPTRRVRYCSRYLKTEAGTGRVNLTGIRAAESRARAKREIIETDTKDSTRVVINPLLLWSDDDIWEYIKTKNLPYYKLYDEGWKRIGCIGCPFGSKKQRLAQFERYPEFKQMYIDAMGRVIAKRKEAGKVVKIDDAEESFEWWLSDMSVSKWIAEKVQMDMFND